MNMTRQDKHAASQEVATSRLDECGVEFEVLHDGAHLVVESPIGKIDFYPGTGLFLARGSATQDRGVENLLRICNG